MKKTLAILLILFALVPVFSQSISETTATHDDLRIVSLAPNVTEMIFAMGAGDQLVGRTDYCNYPAEAQSITSIGTLWDPNMEIILSLDADVAIASSIVNPEFIESLLKAGLSSYQFYHEDSFDGTFTLIKEVAEVIGREAEAEKIIEDMKDRIAEVQKKVGVTNERRTAVFMIGYGDWGDYAATGDTYLDGVIRAAGAYNAAADGVAWSISRELLLEQDPDVIILSGYEGMDFEQEAAYFSSLEPYNQLSACKNGKVFVVDGDAAQRQGVRTAQTVEDFAKVIWPEFF
jgi:iron complex transport system substrate-binding protein